MTPFLYFVPSLVTSNKPLLAGDFRSAAEMLSRRGARLGLHNSTSWHIQHMIFFFWPLERGIMLQSLYIVTVLEDSICQSLSICAELLCIIGQRCVVGHRKAVVNGLWCWQRTAYFLAKSPTSFSAQKFQVYSVPNRSARVYYPRLSISTIIILRRHRAPVHPPFAMIIRHLAARHGTVSAAQLPLLSLTRLSQGPAPSLAMPPSPSVVFSRPTSMPSQRLQRTASSSCTP